MTTTPQSSSDYSSLPHPAPSNVQPITPSHAAPRVDHPPPAPRAPYWPSSHRRPACSARCCCCNSSCTRPACPAALSACPRVASPTSISASTTTSSTPPSIPDLALSLEFTAALQFWPARGVGVHGQPQLGTAQRRRRHHYQRRPCPARNGALYCIAHFGRRLRRRRISPPPETIAAAVTLATLSDSRPPTSHSQQHDENMLEDDDQGGGISLMEGTDPSGEGEVGVSMAPVEIVYSGGFSGFSATWMVPNPPPLQAAAQQSSMTIQSAMPSPLPPPLGNASSVAWFDVGNMSISTMNIGLGPTYTYSPTTSPPINSLEPPPFLHETHLNIPDNGSFMPISTFFHHMSSSGPTVPGLDLVKISHSITRDDLRGNHYDFQGIDWDIRKTTRAAVRSKRFAHQAGLLQGAPSVSILRVHLTPILIMFEAYPSYASQRQLFSVSKKQYKAPCIIPTLPTPECIGSYLAQRHLLCIWS